MPILCQEVVILTWHAHIAFETVGICFFFDSTKFQLWNTISPEWLEKHTNFQPDWSNHSWDMIFFFKIICWRHKHWENTFEIRTLLLYVSTTKISLLNINFQASTLFQPVIQLVSMRRKCRHIRWWSGWLFLCLVIFRCSSNEWM